MIGIINTGETDEDGAHRYRLQINDNLVAEFTHNRMDGLAICLQRAAEAAHLAHASQIDRILLAVAEGQHG
jgi:hypothetical protein